MKAPQTNHITAQNFIPAYQELLAANEKDSYCSNVLKTILNMVEKSVLQKNPPISRLERFKRTIQYLLYRDSFSLSDDSKNYDVLLWPVQLIHVEFLTPVYHELKAMGISAAFICVRKDVADLIRHEKAALIMIGENRKRNILTPNFRRLRKVNSIVRSAKNLNSKYNNLSTHIEQALNNFYFYESYSSLFDLAHKKFSPKYHLLGYDLSAVCRAINIKAIEYGKPTGNIQHGAINYNLTPFSLCTQQFLWDELAFDYFKKINFTGELYLTGSPNKSHLPEITKASGELIKFLKSKPEIKILICFSGPGHNVSEEGHLSNLDIINHIVNKYPDYYFIIKLHPKDKRSYYGASAEKANVLMVDQQHPFYRLPITDFLSVSKILITGASTVAVEALIYKKPVISLDVKAELGHVDFLKSPMVYQTNDATSFEDAIASILGKDGLYTEKEHMIAAYSKRYFDHQNGNPAKAIAELIHTKITAN